MHAKPRDENQWVSCGKNAQKSYQPNNVHFQTCLILRDLPLDLHLDCISFTETPALGSLSSQRKRSAGLTESSWRYSAVPEAMAGAQGDESPTLDTTTKDRK